MTRAKFAFFGSSDFGLPALDHLRRDPRFVLQAVVTQPARPRGRGHVLTPTPVAAWAQAQSIPLFEWASLRNNPEALATLPAWNCDFMLVAAYGCIVPAELLALTTGWVNLHASILPRHRGASPITAAIAAGDPTAGISIMQMDAGIDTGPVLKMLTYPIPPQATAPEVEAALSHLAVESLPDVLAAWQAGTLRAQTQDSAQATYAGKLTKDHGHADWSSATVWERRIRAYQPWPGVWAMWHQERMALLEAEVELGTPDRPLGTIVQRPTGWGITCGDGWLIPIRVQREGRGPVSAGSAGRDWSNLIGTQLT